MRKQSTCRRPKIRYINLEKNTDTLTLLNSLGNWLSNVKKPHSNRSIRLRVTLPQINTHAHTDTHNAVMKPLFLRLAKNIIRITFGQTQDNSHIQIRLS